MNRLDWLILALVAYGVKRMIVNKEHIEHTRYLIERLRLVYQAGMRLDDKSEPLTIEQLDRLLRCIASEGYGLR